MLKKAVQQGRSERRGEEVQTALRVGRSPLEMDLGERKSPASNSDLREALFRTLSPLSDAKTPLAAFSSILFVLENTACP